MQESAEWPQYLTVSELARYLRLKERKIYDLVSRKEIPCSRATGKLIFPRRLVDRWVEAHIEFQDARLLGPPPIVAGSSDPLLEWAIRESGSGLATLFEGSERGQERLIEGQAVAAGIHFFGRDERGELRDALRAGIPDLVLIRWAAREQGLVVARGNPLRLGNVADLAAKRPRTVLRQPGAGARLLFERLLAEAGHCPADLNAVAPAALTETDLAAMIADGEADCGLAIGAVARRFNLDFVPLVWERFNLACRRRAWFEPPLQALFAFARTDAFHAKAAALGHYDVGETGTVAFNK